MKLRNGIYLLIGAFIWGTAFVAQSVGNNYMGPVTFQAARSWLAVIVLLPLVLLRRHFRRKRAAQGDRNVPQYTVKDTVIGCLVTGIFFTAASTFQQIGLVGTEVGKGGFLTDLYIVLVPVLAFILYRRSNIRVWIGVAVAALGMYFLCVSNGFSSISGYDLVLILCAFLFACQITCVDYFVNTVDDVTLSMGQFLVSGIISSVLAPALETVNFSGILEGWFPVFYAGVFSSGIAYTFQIVGQKGQDPTIASLIMSLESVFSALSGWIILHQTLSGRELFGCALMFAAIVLTQLPYGGKAAVHEEKKTTGKT